MTPSIQPNPHARFHITSSDFNDSKLTHLPTFNKLNPLPLTPSQNQNMTTYIHPKPHARNHKNQNIFQPNRTLSASTEHFGCHRIISDFNKSTYMPLTCSTPYVQPLSKIRLWLHIHTQTHMPDFQNQIIFQPDSPLSALTQPLGCPKNISDFSKSTYLLLTSSTSYL